MAQEPVGLSSPSHPWKLIEDFGKFVSVVTATLLVLSTAYDFSFLHALGLTFEELPSTLADHVRSAIVWVPRALLYVAAYAVYELFMSRVEGGLSEEEIIARSRTPRFTRAFRRSPRLFISILIPLGIVVQFLFSASEQGLFFLALFVWGSLSLSVVKHQRLGARFTPATRRLFVVVPLVVIWVANLGYGRGEAMLNANAPIWKIELKTVAATETRSVVGLRRFSEAAVLVEPGRRVSVVPADSILRAEALRRQDADIPRLCRWWGAGCGKPVKATP
jgi:hypothetical protein